MSNIKYREYRPGDEKKHVELMWESSPHVRNIAYWKWINNKCGNKEPILQYAINEKHIIGSYVVHPVEVFLGKRKISAAFATQVLVHSSYRDLRILKNLSENISNACGKSGVEFIYGFPNSNIWEVYLRLFEWSDVGKIQFLACDISEYIKKNFKKNSQYDVSILDQNDIFFIKDLLDAYKNLCFSKGGVFLNKTVEWFEWRYFQNPMQHYKVLYAQKNSSIFGVLVIKYYNNGKRLVGHIVDIIIAESDAEIIDALINKSFSFFKFIGITEISLWRTREDWIKRYLISAGFSVTDRYSNFGIRKTGKSHNESIYNQNNWDLCMGNSDAF